MFSSSFSRSSIMSLKPSLVNFWATLGVVAWSLSPNVYAANPVVLSHHKETITRSVFSDGAFAIKSEGTYLSSGDIKAEDNQLTIRGSTEVNGPVGAFAFRRTKIEELPGTPDHYSVEAENNRLFVESDVRASAV